MKTHSIHNYSFTVIFRITFLTILISIITTTTFAQPCEFCPGGSSSNNLSVSSTKKYITFDRNITNLTILKQILNLPNAVIQGFGELSILNGLDNVLTSKTIEDNWAIIENMGIGNSILSTNNLILSELPVYLTSNNEELAISHLLYVKLNSPSDFQLLENLAQQNNIELLGNNAFMPLWYTLSCSKNSLGNALQMANLFYQTGLFTAVQPDYMIKIESSCGSGPLIDPLFPNQWGLENTGQNGGTAGIDINLCQAHQLTTGSNDVVVAVIDDGFEKTHLDLTNFHPASFDTYTGNTPSQNYGSAHGINVAGVIGANRNNGIGVTGIAPECPIIQISRNHQTTGSPNEYQRLASGISFAWQNGAAVINNSWKLTGLSNPCMLMINNAFSNAMTQGRNGLGTVVVFASANDNASTVSYPANFHPDIIAVGAMSPCGERWSPTSCLSSSINGGGSNYGIALDVVAPGELIPTIDLDGGYTIISATSSAAPHVAGVAALILSVNPCLTQQQVGEIIETTAQKVGSYNYQTTIDRPNGIWHEEMGYGLVDAEAAVLLAKSMMLTPVVTTTDATCSGADANGSASVTITGGVVPYTTQWGIGHQSLTTLDPGNYSVTVTDANGCQVVEPFTINQDPSVLFIPYQTTITGNVTWNQPLISVDGEVSVADGATLTIANGTRVEFSHRADQFDILPNGVARLIVRPGGNLIVEDFAILTGCGGGEWDGIRVLGTGQFLAGQATATIGEAIIENAYIGVANFDFPKINQGIVNNQGGQITATGTTFKNNRTGIFTRRNVNGVPYLVSNCNFIYDGNSLYSYTHLFEDQPTHISINETTNFTATANNYNGGVNDFPAAERGYGISCFDCEININNPIAGTQEFNGLTRAINSYHLGSNMITVNNVNINNCQEGIYLQGADLAEINNSTFNIATADAQDTYGVYLVGAGGTQVQGNNFIGGVSSALDSYGLIAETTGSDGALVFDNTFEGTDYGLQTQGENPAFKIRCNNFGANGSSHNQYAWATVPKGADNTLMNQGLDCDPTGGSNVNENQAGNEWLDNCATGTTDVYVDDNISFAYKAHQKNAAGFFTTQPNCSSPLWISNLDLEVCVGVDKTTTSCNSPFAGITVNPDVDFDAYTSEVKTLIGTYQNEVIALTNLIDGGNTLALLSAINSQPVGNVKNTLLNASPYLSDEVLLAYLNKTPPAGHIKQVIEQNSPVTAVVAQKLATMNLPTGIRNQINALQTGVSERQRLEQQILSMEGEIQLLINDLRRRFRVRLEKPKEKQLLEDMARVETDKSLVKIYLDENNTVSSKVKLNRIAQHNTTENAKFCTLMNCLVTAKEQNRTVDELTTSELQTVETVAFSETKVANNAQVITNKNPNQFIGHPIVKINTSNNLRQLKLQEDETLTVANFNLYPNPSTGLLTIQPLEKTDGNYSIEIINAHGQRVITQKLTNDVINLSSFTNGIYLVRVLNNYGVAVNTNRIILQK